jgi:hypothetical protein
MSRETNSLSNDEEFPTPCSQQRIINAQGDAPWGNGLAPRITIQPGPRFNLDKAACSTNSYLLTKMEDDFMKSVSKARKNKQQFDTKRPEFAVQGGACVTSSFVGYADQQDRYQWLRQFGNGGFPPAAAPTGWNDGSWNGPQAPQAGQPYTAQPWQPPPYNPAPSSGWGQPAPQAQPWGQPAPQAQPWAQAAQPQWQGQGQSRPAQNQPQNRPGDRGWQPYTATVTVSAPSQPQYTPQSPAQDQWQPDPWG